MIRKVKKKKTKKRPKKYSKTSLAIKGTLDDVLKASIPKK